MGPGNGRFTGMDAYGGEMFNTKTLHKYTYVENNPVILVDFSGYSPSNELAAASHIEGILATSSQTLWRHLTTYLKKGKDAGVSLHLVKENKPLEATDEDIYHWYLFAGFSMKQGVNGDLGIKYEVVLDSSDIHRLKSGTKATRRKLQFNSAGLARSPHSTLDITSGNDTFKGDPVYMNVFEWALWDMSLGTFSDYAKYGSASWPYTKPYCYTKVDCESWAQAKLKAAMKFADILSGPDTKRKK